MDLSTLTITEARRALDAREYSALDLTNAYLRAIEEADSAIHAYLEVWTAHAREEAIRADAMIANGEARPLTGVPVAIKDNILVEGRVASGGSKILERYRAPYSATVIERLQAEGAVLLGRTNMDEFAMGSSTENSAFGPTKNPHDLSRVPGGSSGGSAAAVAGGLALAALGSDTGGSIRQPASHCGLVGLKPTYGAVSRFGLMPMGSSLDQIGPLAKTLEDAQILFHAIRGHDERDSTSLPDSAHERTHTPKRVVGVPRAFVTRGVESGVLERFNETLEELRAGGYEVRDVEMPHLTYALPAYYIICPAEVSTNLARYDGVRYGSVAEGETVEEMYVKTRGAGLGPEARRRTILGTFVLSAGYADAYYRRARKVRELIRGEFSRVFASVDAVALPVSPNPAFKIGEKSSDPLAMYAEDIFSVTANLAGIPAISIAAGTVQKEGKALPVGFQLMAPHSADDVLFEIGGAAGGH